jgi:beta-lactamase class A
MLLDVTVDQASLESGMNPDILHRVEEAASDFADQEPVRAVALKTLKGPAIELAAHGDELLPAASLVKLPLAATVYEHAIAGNISFDERVLRSDLGRTAYPSILEVFPEEHAFTLSELCGLMLATSDNPSSQYLLERVGLDAVNAEIRRLGATRTSIVVGFEDNELGKEGRANTTTANDTVLILEALSRNTKYEPLLHAMRNNQRNFRIPLRLPDTVSVAHKTGSLDGVANDAGIVHGKRVDLAIAFLSDGQSDTALTSVAIGDYMAKIWKILGEE